MTESDFLDAINLFENEMKNEIYESMIDEVAQDSLVRKVESVKATVLATCEAKRKK